MSMKINSSMSSSMSGYYNSGSVDRLNADRQVNRIDRIDPVEEAKRVDALIAKERDEALSKANKGVVQTRVSPDNAFQKAMVTDPSFAYERLAGKLLDKLPNILQDMKNLPEGSAFDEKLAKQAVEAGEKTPSKVVISEDGRMTGQPAEPEGPENIQL